MSRPAKSSSWGKLFSSTLCGVSIWHASILTCNAQTSDGFNAADPYAGATYENIEPSDAPVQMEPWLADLFQAEPRPSGLALDVPVPPPIIARPGSSDDISAAISANSKELILLEPDAQNFGESYLEQDPILHPEPMQAAQELDLDLDGQPDELPTTLAARLLQDQKNFYSPASLMMIGSGLGIGAVFANTNLDDGIQRHLHTSLHRANTDEWLEGLHANKEFGDGRITLPVFAGAWAMGHFLPNMPYSENIGTWGERSIRGFVAGAPAVVMLQMATGASRPNETRHTSEWEPFQDNNGVSGHAFMGALPFITAAKMTDSRGLKTLFYAGSALAPLSRTADGAHYPSQVALGWWMAYVAATAVHATDRPGSNWSLYPTATSNSSGMAFEYRY